MIRKMRIVAFGDSLTVGFQSPTPANPMGRSTPYGEFLEEMLGDRAEVIVRGISGELTEGMVIRIHRDVLPLRPDYVVVLGGSNDLGWELPIPEIHGNLVTIYERIKASGAIPVALTVPSIRGFDVGIQPRLTLNRLIMDYGRSHGMPVVDLFEATAEPETKRLAARYSNDGLHLTTEGYRRTAELLFDQVFRPIVNRQDIPSPHP